MEGGARKGGRRDRERGGEGEGLLGLKLVGKNQICVAK